MAERAGPHLVVSFARALRGVGLQVPVDSVVQCTRAVGALGLDRRIDVYWAGRTTLVRRLEDVPLYDAAFEVFWRAMPWSDAPSGRPSPSGVTDEVTGAPASEGVPAPVQQVSYSDVERLWHKDLAACTPEELAEVYRLLHNRRVGAVRRSRRTQRTSHARGPHDARATVRRTLRTGGEVIRLEHRTAKVQPRRVVLLCDVSGSMEPYSRALMRFVHLAVAGRGSVEAFALGTRLTRLTRELSTHDPDAALARVAARVPDWSGGTRLGEGIGAFNERFGMPGMARGAVVAILSDGWDRGEPVRLADEMARLQRAAYQIIWVNPLKASAGYEPLARGMAAALPHVDRFVEGHSAASLESLVSLIAS